MKTDKVRDLIRDKAERSEAGALRLSCSRAFEISRKCRITPRKIGAICNENNIKISKCQLGCFA